jgi:hypothetical protein
MFSRWIVTNITSAKVTTFLAFLAGIISWSVYCTITISSSRDCKHLTRVPHMTFDTQLTAIRGATGSDEPWPAEQN